MNPTEMTPREVDERLWELAQEDSRAQQKQAAAVVSMYRMAGAKEVTYGRGRGKYTRWEKDGEQITVAQAKAEVEAAVAAGGLTRGYYTAQMQATLDRYAESMSKRREIAAAAEAFNDEWQQRQWSRFFLVTNTGGHVHSSMSCSTCFPTTEFAWLPSVSGKTEAEAVAEYGPVLCSVCFPTAPVEWTVGAAAEKAKSECPGSRTYNYDTATARMGYYTGNAGTCNVCGERVTLTSANKLRGHKPKQPEG